MMHETRGARPPFRTSTAAVALLVVLFTVASPCVVRAQSPAPDSQAATPAPNTQTAADPSAETGETVRDVNPADNISKFEVLPRLTVVDGASSVSLITTTLKYDKAIRGKYGLNFEFPVFARFESPLASNNGVGDINLRFRIQGTSLISSSLQVHPNQARERVGWDPASPRSSHQDLR